MRIHTGHLSLLITLSKLTCITAITIEDFYQFGSEAGDAAIGRTLDGSSPPIILPSPFNFFGQSSNRMFVSYIRKPHNILPEFQISATCESHSYLALY